MKQVRHFFLIASLGFLVVVQGGCVNIPVHVLEYEQTFDCEIVEPLVRNDVRVMAEAMGYRDIHACLPLCSHGVVGIPYSFQVEFMEASVVSVKIDSLSFFDENELLDLRNGCWEDVKPYNPYEWKSPMLLSDGRSGVSIPVFKVELPWKELQATLVLCVRYENAKEECFKIQFQLHPKTVTKKQFVWETRG